MAKLIATAIKFYLQDNSYPQIVCSKRHCDCFEWLFNYQVKYIKETLIEGFLTEDNQFVDRHDAYWIAAEEEQLSSWAIEEYFNRPVIIFRRYAVN